MSGGQGFQVPELARLCHVSKSSHLQQDPTTIVSSRELKCATHSGMQCGRWQWESALHKAQCCIRFKAAAAMAGGARQDMQQLGNNGHAVQINFSHRLAA